MGWVVRCGHSLFSMKGIVLEYRRQLPGSGWDIGIAALERETED